MNGVLRVLKPPGMTSHDVVAFVRRTLQVRKAGHTGTLDPDAAGLLPICVGRATKVASFMQETAKAYRAEMTLGVTTDTLDASGSTTGINTDFSVPPARIGEVLAGFVGDQEQVPPMVSAVHHQGERLYELARRGEEVPRERRPVTIHSLRVVAITPDDPYRVAFGARVLLDVTCSKGTYIRTLCADVGEALGCGAHISFLIRTRVGELDIQDAVTLEELVAAAQAGDPERYLAPLDIGLGHLPRYDLDPDAARLFKHGRGVPHPPGGADLLGEGGDEGREGLVRLYESQVGLLGVARAVQGQAGCYWQPVRVFVDP